LFYPVDNLAMFCPRYSQEEEGEEEEEEKEE